MRRAVVAPEVPGVSAKFLEIRGFEESREVPVDPRMPRRPQHRHDGRFTTPTKVDRVRARLRVPPEVVSSAAS
ncbi:hypothetical protein MRX96_039301 [Rhipicephalus microplus]